MISQIWSIALLCFGFGFVIFFHELGHFLAAKYVGIKVEQFAVGFGQAMFSWRKGLGWTCCSSAKKYEERVLARTSELRNQSHEKDLELKEKVGVTASDELRAVESLGL